jgi:hypothetical protein
MNENKYKSDRYNILHFALLLHASFELCESQPYIDVKQNYLKTFHTPKKRKYLSAATSQFDGLFLNRWAS